MRKTSKNAVVATPVGSRTGSPAPVRSAVIVDIAAIDEKTWLRFSQSMKSAGATTLSSTPSVGRFSQTITS